MSAIADLRSHRERMVQAIMDRLWQRSLEAFPDGIPINAEHMRAFYDSYRPYAEADVDAIIAALASSAPMQEKP